MRDEYHSEVLVSDSADSDVNDLHLEAQHRVRLIKFPLSLHSLASTGIGGPHLGLPFLLKERRSEGQVGG
ncbi:hypothetical protein CMK12_03435 [Candidatus Poribacteria bacterium]|nr:hypothetical protein [Candidatus Poribacteria bacterium]